MINMQYPDVTVRESHLQAVLYNKDMIRAMAVQMVTNQVEAHLAMISDAGQEEYSTYKDVADCIQGAQDSVKEYIADLLGEFRDTLHEEIAKVKIETKGVILRPDGDVDADVNVTISE